MFRITLEPAARPIVTGDTPDSDDDYITRTIKACAVLEETDCRFRVHGFGEDWPVDIGYDLSTFVEGLPELLHAVRSGTFGEADFYGQGIERRLAFHPAGDAVRIVCESRTSWSPDPEVEVVDRVELETMLTAVAVAFGRSLELVSTAMAEQEPYRAWRRGHV